MNWAMLILALATNIATVAYFQGRSNALIHATRGSLQRLEAKVEEMQTDLSNLAVDVAEMRGRMGMSRTRAGSRD